ncbi:hypothetical protein MY4824_008141 [Beauveria thailandica]
MEAESELTQLLRLRELAANNEEELAKAVEDVQRIVGESATNDELFTFMEHLEDNPKTARFEPWWAEPEIFSAYLADGDAGDFADVPPPAYPRGLHMPSDHHGNNKTGIRDMNIFPTQAEIFSNVAEFLPSTDPEQPHFPTDKSQRHINTLIHLL